MQYLITFLEGVVTFVAPCMLPMLPIYFSYFAVGNEKKHSIFIKTIFFVLGFTFVYSMLGMFAGVIGSFFIKYETTLHIVCGAIIVILGLNFLDILKIPHIKGLHAHQDISGIFSAFLFGTVFSLSHLPCIMALLGSALVMAAHEGTALSGILLLVIYSLGMGIPFLASALLIDKLKKIFDAINKHYKVINLISGVLLVLLGVLMMTGVMHHLMGHTHIH